MTTLGTRLIKQQHPFHQFPKVADYSGLNNTTDVGKILKWNSTQWEAADDNQGIDVSALVLGTNFSNVNPKSITNADIGSVKFEHISGLEADFLNKYVDYSGLLQGDVGEVEFSGPLNFDENYTEEQTINGQPTQVSIKFGVSGIGNVVDSSDVVLFAFDDIKTECSSLDKDLFEQFTGEAQASAGLTQLVNADREVVELTPEMLQGDVAGELFDPAKILALSFSNWALGTSPYDLKVHDPTTVDFDPADNTTPGWGTGFQKVFEALAGKINAFVNQESPGVTSAGTAIAQGDFLELTDADNGKMILVENANVKIMDSVSDDFEITIKRVDPQGVDPSSISVAIQLESGTIEKRDKFTLNENFSSVTLKKIRDANDPSSDAEFVLLRRSGSIN